MDILEQDIMYLQGVGPYRKKMLSEELGINTFGDLLEYYPYKYVDRSKVYTIHELTGDMPFVQVKGRILSFEKYEMSVRKTRVVAHFTDGTGILDLVWFNFGKTAMTKYTIGKEYVVFGKPTIFNNRVQIGHPEIEEPSSAPLGEGSEGGWGMRPYYNTTDKMKKNGLTSRAMERLTLTLISRLREPLPETLPPFIAEGRHLMSRNEALRTVHYP